MEGYPQVFARPDREQWEDAMPRSLSLIGVCALALVFSLPAHGQDSPSLGDLARQAQKDKEKANKPSAKVITNDDVPSGSGGGLGQAAQPGAAGNTGAPVSPAEQLHKLESVLDQLDSLDRATLAKNALQGNDTNFPGRDKWEVRLFAAKQTFVSQGRAMLERARQIQASAESLKGVQDPSDPRVKDMGARLQGFVRDAIQIGSAFDAVMMEGRDLAAQTSSH